MKIDKMKLASGDRGELLALARSIKSSTPLSKTANPIASQFFPDDGAAIQHLDLDALVENLAGAQGVARDREIEASAFAQQARDHMGVDGMTKPTATADVSRIGAGGAGSGWNAPKPVVASGAKAERALLLHKIAKTVNPSAADTAILTATLKSIITQLLGVNVESVDPGVLKSKLAATIKARPDLGLRLAKALGTKALDTEPDVNIEDLIALGAKVTKTGTTLHISV